MTVQVRPMDENSQRILDEKESVLFGLSPFNSFYSTATIETLIAWAARRFAKVEAVLPGYEIAFGPIAAGRAPLDAVRRSLRAVRKMRAVTRRALAAASTETEGRVYTWTQLAGHRRYRELRTMVEQTFHTDRTLRLLCEQTSRDYLRGALGHEPSSRQVELNLCYVLAEIPFILDVPGIIGTRSALLLYNKSWPIQEALCSGAVPALRPEPGHGFATVELVESRLEQVISG